MRIAVEMVKEKLIDEKTAILRVEPASLDQLLHPTFDPKAEKNVIAKGLPASPGAAVGKLAFTAEEAEERVAKGEKIILVRRETEPADIGGMHVAEGILTSTGGMTSHAAVVARGMGTPCVAGAGALQIDAQDQDAHRQRQDLRPGRLPLARRRAPAKCTRARSPTRRGRR